MKKSIILSMALVLTTATLAFAQSADDFVINEEGVITAYSGFDTDITIPSEIKGRKVTAIGDRAFHNAELTSVVIPQGVTSIGEKAFSKNQIKNIIFPNSVITINYEAFADNPLTSFILPEKLNLVTYNEYRVNINLPLAVYYNYITNDRKAGTYTTDMKFEKKSADNYEYIETQYGAILISYNGDSTRLRVPSEIDGITVKALDSSVYNGKSIAALQIPNNITYIGNYVFNNNNLTSVTIPNSVTYIGHNAFSSNSLTSVTIPNSVTHILDSAFYSNYDLTSVTIGNSVTYIGSFAFASIGLTSVIIPNTVIFMGWEAFGAQLRSITIGANVQVQWQPFGYNYNKGGKLAGTYTYANKTWTRK